MTQEGLRETGVYAVGEDVTFRVAFHDVGRVVPYEFVGEPHTSGTVATSALQRLEQVTTIATWEGIVVTVTRVTDSLLAWIKTDDADTARRHGLYGDAERGWAAAVPLHELDDLGEVVVDLLR